MKEGKSLEWQNLYRKAVTERDPERLPEQIARAEAAIYSRMKQVRRVKMDEAEERAIDDALRTLRVLKIQHFHGWK
jgi:hypothetical protein